MMNNNPYFTEIDKKFYRGLAYTIYKNEYGFFAEAYDNDNPLRVRCLRTYADACTWIERAIDRWINKGKDEYLTIIQARDEQMLFRTL